MGDHPCCPDCESELNQLSQQNDLLIGALIAEKAKLQFSLKMNLRLADELRKEKERNEPR